jgi:hypothetical protein
VLSSWNTRLALAAFGCVALWFLVSPCGERAQPDERTRATMAEIFEAVRYLLPRSLSDADFEDPEARESVREALHTLAAGADRLEAHGRHLDPGFAFLSRALARDARDSERRFAAGRSHEARFLIQQITHTCVACHSRLPSDRSSPLSARLMEEAQIASLEPDERVRVETATRQFDRALATYEALFRDASRSPADLDLSGHFDAYLELCLRVKDDPARARRTLEAFAARDDVAPFLRPNLESWIASLERVEAQPAADDELAWARARVAEAGDRGRFPDSRQALAHYVAASAALHRYVAAGHPRGPELAEAYYLLGVTEAHAGLSLWLSQTEFFLETAIRLAPHAPFAEDAYALLEEFLVSGYSGSSGEHVPPEEKRRLEELRAMIEAS